MARGPGKGKTNNPQGRPAGTPNKATADLRERIKSFIDNNFENLTADIRAIDSPEKRARVTIELLKYILPAMQSVAVTDPEGKALPSFEIVIRKDGPKTD